MVGDIEHQSFSSPLIVKVEFWTPVSNYCAFTLEVRPLIHIHQIERHGEGQRKEIYFIAQKILWEEAK
jgi:hypothetical protein